jgi:hypothetical protein
MDDLTERERSVLTVIENSDHYIYPSQIAKLLGIPESTARRAANSLCGKRPVRRHQEKRAGYVSYRSFAGEPFDRPGFPPGGFVTGQCGHAVARSAWRAGLRNCERCGG